MKTLTITVYRTYKADFEQKITDVVHNVPTWFFAEAFDSKLKNPCPICHKEMKLNIAHGAYVEKCTMLQLDGYRAMPIHTNCYFGDSNYFKQDPNEFLHEATK